MPVNKSDWASGFLKIKGYNNNLWLYFIGYMNANYSTYYQDLWAQVDGKNYFLDSIFNSDKKIHHHVSPDGKYLIINTLNELSDYYNRNQDNRFTLFSLEDLRSGKVSKEYVNCTNCANGYIVGNKLFFTKSNQRDDFDAGFAWTDIYVSPLNRPQDSVKVAAFTGIIAVSPDGKYILAKRIFDLPNGPRAIIDVENKRYQLLLGRDYAKAHAYHSFKESKFAFDFGDRLVYIDFPSEYPFDALKKNNTDIPSWSDKDFYNQLMHSPFEK